MRLVFYNVLYLLSTAQNLALSELAAVSVNLVILLLDAHMRIIPWRNGILVRLTSVADSVGQLRFYTAGERVLHWTYFASFTLATTDQLNGGHLSRGVIDNEIVDVDVSIDYVIHVEILRRNAFKSALIINSPHRPRQTAIEACRRRVASRHRRLFRV